MTTITLTPDIEKPLAEQARRQGTTPEMLALDGLRRLFAPEEAPPPKASEGETLFDFLQGYVGTVSGASEALSENCGKRFTEDLADASLVAVAESLSLNSIFTLDSDFHFYRLSDGSTLEVIG